MTATIVNLLLALFLLAANAFYVAAEFALVKSRGFRINAMSEQNRFGARLLKKMVGNIEAYLACCQLGITMASLGLGWIGEPTVSAFLWPVLVPLGMSESALHFTSFLIGFLVFSSLHIVIGEQVPKTLAIREPVPVSQWIAYPLHASFLLLYPLSWLLNTASRSILRMLGVRESSTHEILTDVEIEQLVEESAEHGNIEEGQAEFIQNVFRFGELVVSDVMVHRTEMITVCADEALYRCQAWRSRSLRGARDRPPLILWHASRQRALNSRFSMWFTKTARAGQEGQARQADLHPRARDREGLHRKQRQSRRSARFPQREVVGMSAAQFWPYCQS
jgi:CBS domain containing-hemolysin-like protein